MKHSIFLTLATLAVLVVGCAKKTGDSGAGTLLPNVNLSSANAMFVAPSGAKVMAMSQPGAMAASGSLFSMDGSGHASPVALTATSAESSNNVVSAPNFVAIATSNVVDSKGKACGVVLIEKGNGNTHCVLGGIASFTDFYKPLQADGTSTYIYFLDGNKNLQRFNSSDPNLATTQVASNVVAFSVDSDGDALVDYWSGNDVTTNVLEIIPVSGAAQVITTNEVGSITTINGSGASNTFYYASSPADCGSAYCELVKSGGSFSKQVAGFTIPMCLPGESCSFTWVGTTLVEATTPTAGVYWFFTSSGQVNMVSGGVAASNISGTLPNKIDRLTGANGTVAIQAEDSSGKTGLYRFNLGTGIFDTLMTAGDYQISTFDVDSSGNTTVSAKRTADGANVVATVAAGSSTVSVGSTVSQVATSMATLH